MRKKKLALHKETLRALTGNHLGRIVGGTNTYEILTGCASDCETGGTANCPSDGCGTGGSNQCQSLGGDTCTCIIPPSYCHC
jgi:hypothetical protein